LLDNSTTNPDAEKFSIPNNPSLRGFEVIDAIKDALETACPGTVSCADIIAFAARDASYLLGKITYDIPSGRYDGRVSNSTEALSSLPPPFFNLTQLIDIFAKNNLSIVDLVTLSGAHSIGRSHCSSFTTRLYPTIDPTMDQDFGSFLRTKCPANVSTDGIVAQDFITPDNLDTNYYDNVQSLKGLFFSDWSLLTSPETLQLVEDYSSVPGLFEESFGKSMVNMGYLGVLDETQGEIRKSCSAIN
jgi:peroxidase